MLGTAQGLAAFLGGFILLNLLGELRYPGFDANIWLIDLRLLPRWAQYALLASAGLGLVAYVVRPAMNHWLRRLALALNLALLIACTHNAATFYSLMAKGRIASTVPVSFSSLVAACIAVIITAQARIPQARNSISTWFLAVMVCGLCLPAFPLAQMYCLGRTDYRRPADAAVVFGARAYADGRPSDALADRVRTGCDLYNSGLVRLLIMSGGPGDGEFHETDVMRKTAMKLGVPGDAIMLDKDGLNTQATVNNTLQLFSSLDVQRVLVVSHFYHLPRIKMAYQRSGWEVCTVPARESYTLTMMPFYVAREIAALWLYYLRPLLP